MRLPLVAAVKGSEPHMPVSHVSISSADSTLTVGSHDGCLRHYRYTQSDVAASSSGGKAFGCQPDDGRASSSTHEGRSALGSDSSYAQAEEREHQTERPPSSHSEDGPDSDSNRLPVSSLRGLEMTENSGETCSGNQQRTDHDREESSHRDSTKAEQAGGQQADSASGSLRGSRDQGGHTTALGNLNVEAVSALTVIESQLSHRPDREGRPDQLLSGFQVSSQPTYWKSPATQQGLSPLKVLSC